MTHLNDDELVDFVESRLEGGRAAHAEACDRCRVQGEELRAILRDAREVAVPEPSPLFWDHFSARVRGAVAEEPMGAPGWSVWVRARLVPGLALMTAAIALVVAATVWQAPKRFSVGERQVAGTAPGDTIDTEPLLDDTAEWAFVVNVAQDLEWETIHDSGLTVRPEAAERAVLQLSQDERRELARLLEAELERSKS